MKTQISFIVILCMLGFSSSFSSQPYGSTDATDVKKSMELSIEKTVKTPPSLETAWGGCSTFNRSLEEYRKEMLNAQNWLDYIRKNKPSSRGVTTLEGARNESDNAENNCRHATRAYNRMVDLQEYDEQAQKAFKEFQEIIAQQAAEIARLQAELAKKQNAPKP